MKALWVTILPTGPAASILGATTGTSGGWIQTIYDETKGQGFDIDFLCYSKEIKKGERKKVTSEEGTAYCLNLPKVSYGVKPTIVLRRQVEDVIGEVKPDIIHIWGTETVVQNVVASCSPNIPKVVFLQGLIGIHSRYYGGRLKEIGLKMQMSPKELFVYQTKKRQFKIQSGFEQEELRRAGNVILDNAFSAAYCKAIDHSINLYRYWMNSNQVFEKYEWSLEKCHKHRIFTVFGSGPDKGLHQLIKAVAIVKQNYSDVEMVVPGIFHITTNGKLEDNNKLTDYERLLNSLINQYGLRDNVTFCGRMNPEGMAKQISNAHCFVNPSIMEVHAGSLREAMTVGIPSITTFCGSVCEFVQEGITGWMYRYEEHEVLAYKIMKLFENDEMAVHVGNSARKLMTSLRIDNEKTSVSEIYKDVISRVHMDGLNVLQ